VEVKDTGIGMSQTEQARLFQRFSQATNFTSNVLRKSREGGWKEGKEGGEGGREKGRKRGGRGEVRGGEGRGGRGT
jgi:hypothetical protein